MWDLRDGKELYHTGRARADTVAFTPDGRFLVLDGLVGIEFHDAHSGKLMHVFPRVSGHFTLSPDGTRLATAHRDQLRVWDISRVTTPKGNGSNETDLPLVQAFNGHEGSIVDMVFRPDGQAVATTGADGTIRLWDLSLEAEPIVLRGHMGRVAAVAFHPDGRALASGGQPSGDIQVWDTTRKTECIEAISFARETRDVVAIGFGKDDRELLAISLGGVLRRWECSTGSIQERELHSSNTWFVPATLAAFSSDGQYVATIAYDDSNQVKILHTETGREAAVLRGHTVRVRFLACDRDCRHIVTAASGMRDNRPIREVKVWDTRTGKILREETALDEQCDAVAISPDGTQLLEAHRVLEAAPTGGMRVAANGAVLTLSSVSGTTPSRTLPVWPGVRISALTFGPQGRCVAAGASDGTIRIWDRDGKALHEAPLPGPENLGFLAFNPDESRLAAVNRERVQVLDVISGQDVLFLRGAGPRPSDNGFNPQVAWSHDGTKLAVSNWDRSVSIWDSVDLTKAEEKIVLASQAASRALLWHLERIEAYRRPEMAFAVKFHRERLLALKSLTPLQYRKRGDFLARSGRWKEATADYANLFTDGLPENAEICREYASLLVKTGDHVAYQKIRSAALARCATERDIEALEPLIHLSGLLPTSTTESKQLLEAARRFQAAKPQQGLSLTSLALALCHSGEWEEAKQTLLQALALKRGDRWVHTASVRLGMVLMRLGKPAEAEEWLKREDEWLANQDKLFPPTTSVAPIDCVWSLIVEVRQLRNEVEALRVKPAP